MTNKNSYAATYGTLAGTVAANNRSAFYSSVPTTFVTGDIIQGFAYLPTGLTIPNSGTVTFNYVWGQISGPITLGTSSILAINGGDLHLDPTTLTIGTGASINASGSALIFDSDFTFPTGNIAITSDLILDGQGNTITLNSGTKFVMSTGVTVTLQNMYINGLQNGTQFAGGNGLALKNCVLNVSGNTGTTAFSYGSLNSSRKLYIHNDVIVQGGGTLAFGGNGSLAALIIQPFSTLFFDLDTTFSYWAADNTNLRMYDTTSTIYLNGATLLAGASAAGLQITGGRLIMDNNCTLSVTTLNLGGSGTSATNTKILGGACIQVAGRVLFNG